MFSYGEIRKVARRRVWGVQPIAPDKGRTAAAETSPDAEDHPPIDV